MIAAKWLGTLVKAPKNLLEKKERDVIVKILERFDIRG